MCKKLKDNGLRDQFLKSKSLMIASKFQVVLTFCLHCLWVIFFVITTLSFSLFLLFLRLFFLLFTYLLLILLLFSDETMRAASANFFFFPSFLVFVAERDQASKSEIVRRERGERSMRGKIREESERPIHVHKGLVLIISPKTRFSPNIWIIHPTNQKITRVHVTLFKTCLINTMNIVHIISFHQSILNKIKNKNLSNSIFLYNFKFYV